jgi:hypothetical protein
MWIEGAKDLNNSDQEPTGRRRYCIGPEGKVQWVSFQPWCLHSCIICACRMWFFVCELCWTGNWGSSGKTFSKAERDIRSIYNVWFVKIGLVISVDKRHGNWHRCPRLLYSWRQIGSIVINIRSLHSLWVVPAYMSTFDAISGCFFFLCRLKINHMMELQIVRLFLNLAQSWTAKNRMRSMKICFWATETLPYSDWISTRQSCGHWDTSYIRLN